MVKGLSSTVNYNYDIANRLTNVDGVPYVYDDNGNLLSDGQNTYTYDSANRLSSVSSEQGVESSYLYNGLGDRLSQNGVNYTLDLNFGLTQVLSDGTTSYTYGLGRISQQSGNASEYFLGDALGSVRQLTDQAGAITYAASYDPYGVVTQSSGAGQSAYGYTGEQQDASGLVYLRARYYNPNDGRFMSRDTWGGDENRPMSMNRWMYASGNPIRFIDPTGHYYDRQAAVANAYQHDLIDNAWEVKGLPGFQCTNFASSVLWAGGIRDPRQDPRNPDPQNRYDPEY